jgi:hypothetical protein
MRVYRTDLGVTETYYGLFNASTNPGGRDVAGWYDTEKTQGLVPLRPSSATFASGSGSVNSMGQISFTSCGSISLSGLFSSKFTNYKIVCKSTINQTANNFMFSLRAGASVPGTVGYYFGHEGFMSGGASSYLVGARYGSDVRLGRFAGVATSTVVELETPNLTQPTSFTYQFSDQRGDEISEAGFGGGTFWDSTAYDGFAIYPSSGLISGIIQIFGYNK